MQHKLSIKFCNSEFNPYPHTVLVIIQNLQPSLHLVKSCLDTYFQKVQTEELCSYVYDILKVRSIAV
jgi:hypothetical protein